MYESHSVLYSRYGAFALKAAYQRNLIQSQMIVVGAILLGFAVVILWPRDSIIAITPPGPPMPIDSVVITIEQQPTIITDGPAKPDPLPEDVRVGIPEPVPGDAETDVSIPTTEEIIGVLGTGDSVSTGGLTIDTSAVDGLDGPEFKILEIYPAPLDEVTAEYPQLAQSAGIEGTVVLYGLVSESGEIIEVRIAKSSEYTSLDEAASVALKKMHWKPGIQNGKPVKCWITKTYRFEID